MGLLTNIRNRRSDKEFAENLGNYISQSVGIEEEFKTDPASAEKKMDAIFSNMNSPKHITAFLAARKAVLGAGQTEMDKLIGMMGRNVAGQPTPQQVRGGGQPNIGQPGVGGIPSPDVVRGVGVANIPGRPQVNPWQAFIDQKVGSLSDQTAAQKLYDDKQKKIQDLGLTSQAARDKARHESDKTNMSVQLSTQMFADGVTDVYREMSDVLKDKLGLSLDPTRGLQGKAFGAMMKVMNEAGYLGYFDSIAKGMTNELAAEFAKAGGASRLGFFILNAFKDTIFKLGDETLESGGFQLVKSAVNGYRKYIKENFSDSSVDENLKRLDAFEAAVTEKIFGGWTDAGIYKQQLFQFKTEDMDTSKVMPHYMIKFYADDNNIKLKDIDKVKRKYIPKEQ